MDRRFFVTLLAPLAFAALAACSGGSGGNTPTQVVFPPGPPPPVGPTQLFVTNFNANNVLGFALPVSGNQPPTVNIVGGATALNGPWGLFVDAAGKIYVTNITSGAITTYPAGANGNTAPTQNIAGAATLVNSPEGITADATGKIYISNGDGGGTNKGVLAFAPGATGNVAPVQNITGPATQITDATGITLDLSGTNIMVANFTGQILTFPAGATGNVAPTSVLSGAATTLVNPDQIALDAAGKLYVRCRNGSILVFAAGASGNTAPIATISGAATGLTAGGFGTGVTVDRVSGKIYASNPTTNTILVFAAGANGNVAPIATLTGAATLLNQPAYVALH